MKKTKKWKIILILILMLPVLVFFPACGDKENTNGDTSLIVNSTHTVHFYTGTSSSHNYPNQIVQHGGTVREPSQKPTRAGYAFIGWFKDKECTIPWKFTLDVVTLDMTLYAGWQAYNSGF